MWSLPDINRLNKSAADAAFQAKCDKEVKGKAKLQCEFCDKPATKTSRQYWYDIFSNDPKGVIGLCQEHENDFGSIPEGYFYCDACGRLFIQNYTWENYFTEGEDGELVCLNCAAEKYVRNQDNWINLEGEEDLDFPGQIFSPAIEELDFERVRKAPHIIAVEGPIPDGIEKFDSVTLDSFSGGRVTGFSSSESSPDGGVSEMQDILRKARDAGHSEALLILDGGFQFCVSIGVYVRA